MCVVRVTRKVIYAVIILGPRNVRNAEEVLGVRPFMEWLKSSPRRGEGKFL